MSAERKALEFGEQEQQARDQDMRGRGRGGKKQIPTSPKKQIPTFAKGSTAGLVGKQAGHGAAVSRSVLCSKSAV